MTIQELANKLAKEEGGKSQAKVGDVRQILRLLANEIQENPTEVIGLLCKYSQTRRKKK